jgi:hypothetical protein
MVEAMVEAMVELKRIGHIDTTILIVVTIRLIAIRCAIHQSQE